MNNPADFAKTTTKNIVTASAAGAAKEDEEEEVGSQPPLPQKTKTPSSQMSPDVEVLDNGEEKR